MLSTFPCLFLFTAVNTIIPSRDLFKRSMLQAISIQQVYKVSRLMDSLKEIVFFAACVGGGSEASCLSTFNWFSVAIGAAVSFSPAHESAALQSTLSGFRSTRRCQGSCPGFYTHHRSPFHDSQLTSERLFSVERLSFFFRAIHEFSVMWFWQIFENSMYVQLVGSKQKKSSIIKWKGVFRLSFTLVSSGIFCNLPFVAFDLLLPRKTV